MSVRPFIVQVSVSDEFLRNEPSARDFAKKTLRESAQMLLLGPRGGRYEAINEPYDFAEGPGDVFSGETLFRARVTGRYVRRRRSSHKIVFHDLDWWGEKGCKACGQPLKIVSMWSRSQHFFAHDYERAEAAVRDAFRASIPTAWTPR